ncbi:proteasome subunit beta type-2-like [Spodoptera litura]|uniref:Proteasome subunit beta n=1 Tax=Spodoptera litura TaxID=69820 RepID=A0A9J7INX7_SPOLT|nr:proteasome subunit beta type-2-like [Spodoptera litura]
MPNSTTLFLQCLMGMQCKDFAIIAADQTNTQSIIVMKHDENKFYHISDQLVMGVIGDPGDRVQFAQFIAKNVQLYKMRNGYQLTTPAAVHFTRKTLMEALKTGNPSMVNMLVAGYDPENGGQLYTVDFLASSVRVPFGVHGFGGLLSLGILDRFHKHEMTEDEAYEVIKQCVFEVHSRLFVSLPNFFVKIINKDGIKDMPIITPATYILKAQG